MPEEDVVKKLTEQNKSLEEKIKNLTKIIEITSQQGKEAGEKGDSDDKLKTHIADLKKSINSIVTKIEAVGKSKPKDIEALEKIKVAVSDLKGKSKDLDRLPALEEKIRGLEDRFASQKGGEQNLFGGFQETPTTKQQAGNLENDLAALEGTFTEFRTDISSKVSDTNKKVQTLMLRLNPQTIRQLQRLSSSKENIVEKLVPQKVKEEVSLILSNFSFDIRDLSTNIKELVEETEKINTRMQYSFTGIEKMKKDLATINDRVNLLERTVLGRSRDVYGT
jgi:chromosome segregation ATPase